MTRGAVDKDRVAVIADVLVDGLVLIELVAQLIKVDGLEFGPERHRALLRRELTEQKAQQRRFTAAVGADDPEPVAAVQLKVQPVDDRPVRPSEAEPLGCDHAPPRAPGLLHGDACVPRAFSSRLSLDAQSLERSNSPFIAGSTRLDPLADPSFLLRELLIELAPGFGFGVQVSLFEHLVAVEITGITCELASVEIENARGDGAQEGAIVCHEENGPEEPLEQALEPLDRDHVEVIGRLIEH